MTGPDSRSGAGSTVADPQGRVVPVTTSGSGSMDRYGRDLAARLGLPDLCLDISGASAGRFGTRTASLDALRLPAGDLAVLRRLRATPGLLHLTHHHLARYAGALGRPYLLTVHDLIRWFDLTAGTGYISRPRGLDRLGLHLDYRAVQRAAHVIAPSRATRDDLVTHLGIAPERVSVVYEGIDHARFRPVAERPLTGPYLLVVGSEHPRKNLDAALRAFALLARDPDLPRLRLVKVGSPGDGEAPFGAPTRELVRRLGLADRVVFTGEVADEELPGYYSGAAALLMPSRYEGFGLPPVEAMACGCPVVVSTAGSLPEVTGGAALTVAPTDVPGLAAAARAVLTRPDLAARLRAQGLDRAQAYHWDRTVAGTSAVYQALLGGSPPPPAPPARPSSTAVSGVLAAALPLTRP